MILAVAAERPPADGLALTAAIYGLVLTAWTLASTLRATPLQPLQHAAAAVLGLASAGLALAYLGSLAGGHRPSSPGTMLGYSLAAILILPAAWPRDAARLPPRLAAGTACIATLALTVVVLRLRVVW